MTDERFPILHIAAIYVDLEKETMGISNSVRQLCLRMAKRGWPVRLMCGNRAAGPRVAEPGRFTFAPNLEVEVFEQRSHPLLGPSAPLRRRLMEIDLPPIAHVHTCFSAFTETAMNTLHKRGTPFIFTPRGKLSPGALAQKAALKKLMWRFTAGPAVRKAAMLGLLSETETISREKLGLTNPVIAIPNGFDPIDLDALRARPPILEEPTILFLSLIDPRKQPTLLVRAYAQSRARETHRLLIVGPDSYNHRGEVEAEIARCGVGDRVTLYGPAYGAEKNQIMAESRCICLPSTGEGYPIVLAEALGAELPAIVSPFCNFGVGVDAGAAVEVETFDEADWAAAIDSVCLDEARRASLVEAARTLGPTLTWDVVVDRWLETYAALRR